VKRFRCLYDAALRRVAGKSQSQLMFIRSLHKVYTVRVIMTLSSSLLLVCCL